MLEAVLVCGTAVHASIFLWPRHGVNAAFNALWM